MVDTFEERLIIAGLDIEVVLTDDTITVFCDRKISTRRKKEGRKGESIHVINVQWTNISQLLNLCSALLALSVRHVQI